MKHWKYEDLPESVKKQVDAQVAAMPDIPSTASPAKQEPPSAKHRTMTKTEMEFQRWWLAQYPTHALRFEPVTLNMTNGHRYKPDFMAVSDTLAYITFIEVKGSYRLGSYQRAKLAFDQVKVEFPMFSFVWAEKTKDGWRLG